LKITPHSANVNSEATKSDVCTMDNFTAQREILLKLWPLIMMLFCNIYKIVGGVTKSYMM